MFVLSHRLLLCSFACSYLAAGDVKETAIQRCPRGNISKGKELAQPFAVRSILDCAMRCVQRDGCVGANVCESRASDEGGYLCGYLESDGFMSGCRTLEQSSIQCFVLEVKQNTNAKSMATAVTHLSTSPESTTTATGVITPSHTTPSLPAGTSQIQTIHQGERHEHHDNGH